MPSFRILMTDAGNDPKRVLNRLRDVTGFSLAKAEWLLTNLPQPVIDGLEDAEQIARIKGMLENAGASIRSEPTGLKTPMVIWREEFDTLDVVASQFPPRPQSFSWVLKSQLAGMGRPYVATDLEFLKCIGLDLLVSLTEQALPADCIEYVGCEALHVPVPDLTAPSIDQMKQTVAAVETTIQNGGKAVIHCGAGMGRTGVMLAAYLVAKGCAGDEAIRAIREQRPGSIETREQENIILQFSEELA